MPNSREVNSHFTYPPILQNARDMRHPLTPAEARVWKWVRNNQTGYNIRRQHPVFRFIADLYSAAAKLIIEVDGDSQADPDQAEYDAARIERLEARGYKVIRFSNLDCHKNIDVVIGGIKAACEQRVAGLRVQ
jgi:very-short-patch-repair endonuclease